MEYESRDSILGEIKTLLDQKPDDFHLRHSTYQIHEVKSLPSSSAGAHSIYRYAVERDSILHV
jgi:hypothetical protein